MKKILILCLVAMLSSCASKMIPLSSSIRSSLGEKQVAQLQYYTSEKIILKKVAAGGAVNTSNGEVIVSGYDNSETVVIPKRTPGVLTRMEDGTLVIRFEYGDNKYLAFGDNGGIYSLLAKEWKDRDGLLTYAGKEYTTVGLSGSAYLMVKAREVRQSNRRSRTVTGVKLN